MLFPSLGWRTMLISKLPIARNVPAVDPALDFRAWRGHRGPEIETEAAPIRYVAELIGAGTDSEPAIRWLIALMVLCCDRLAIALTAAASARR